MSGLFIVTRKTLPRSAAAWGNGDPVDMLRSVGRAALLASSPHVAEAVALACAKDAGGRAIVLDASDGAGITWLRHAREADHELVIVLRGVRAVDPASISAAVQVAAIRPMARFVVASDRTAAHMLRPHGFRIVPLYAGMRGAPPPAPSEAEVAAALRTAGSAGDPLACPSKDLAVVRGLPLSRTSDGGTTIWTDAWRFSRALAAAFDHSGLSHARRLGRDALAEPAVLAAIDLWAHRRLDIDDRRPVLTDEAGQVSAVLLLGALVRAERDRTGRRVELPASDGERLAVLTGAGDRLLASLAEDGEPSLLAPVADALDAMHWWSSPEPPPELPVSGLGADPVSVQQFARFVAANGYRDSRWWPGGMLGFTEPLQWARQRRYPHRPVVGVNWYEAGAFASWASAQAGRSIVLQSTTDRRAVESAAYPWGDRAPDRTLLNFDLHVGHPNSPRAYPYGSGRHGHRDLAGNVWEWTSTGDRDTAALVGGGWSSTADEVASGLSLPCNRGNRFDDVGFRLCAQ